MCRSTKTPASVAFDAVEVMGEQCFTFEDVEAIASLPLAAIKRLVTPVQFDALSKFVNVNQMVIGLQTRGRFDA